MLYFSNGTPILPFLFCFIPAKWWCGYSIFWVVRKSGVVAVFASFIVEVVAGINASSDIDCDLGVKVAIDIKWQVLVVIKHVL
jgi:hypothetical protein